MAKKLKDIAKYINGELVGEGEIEITGLNGIREAASCELAFIMGPKSEGLIDTTGASAVVVPKTVKSKYNKPVIRVDNASIAFSKAAELLCPDKIPHPKGISSLASISESADIGSNVALGHYSVIDAGASIGSGTVIYPLCYIGKGVKI